MSILTWTWFLFTFFYRNRGYWRCCLSSVVSLANAVLFRYHNPVQHATVSFTEFGLSSITVVRWRYFTFYSICRNDTGNCSSRSTQFFSDSGDRSCQKTFANDFATLKVLQIWSDIFYYIHKIRLHTGSRIIYPLFSVK